MSINKNNENKGVVNFEIDDIFFTSSSPIDVVEEYTLVFSDFLDRSERTQEELSFTRKQVKKAGRAIRKKEGDLKKATSSIQAFRAAHEKPLNTITYLIGRCCRELGISVKPVNRLKRLETIIDKLQRPSLDGITENQTCVTNMGDIGGCRVIFSNVEDLNKVNEALTLTLKGEERVKIKDKNNYIEKPKANDCGYRSLHILYEYKRDCGGRFLIEAQLRTYNQHLWATTVEIVDLIERTNIKTHSHSNSDKPPKQIKWEKLLRIMSDFIAEKDGVIQISDSTKKELTVSLNKLNDELGAVNRLKSFDMMSNKVQEHIDNEKEKHIILLINETTLEVLLERVCEQKNTAISLYNSLENVVTGLDDMNLLLVSTKNINTLAQAYPNYIGDCTAFIELLESAMQIK